MCVSGTNSDGPSTNVIHLEHRVVSSDPDGTLVDGKIGTNAVAGAVVVVHPHAIKGIITKH